MTSKRAKNPAWTQAPSEAAAEGLAAAALIAAPLALGMAHLASALTVSALGWLALATLVTARGGRLPRMGSWPLALLALSAVIALQLVPLPPSWLAAIAPEHLRITGYSLGSSEGWRPLTLDRPATAAELAKWLGWAGAAWVFQHRARTSEGARRRLLIYVALAAAAVAAIGLLHFAAGEKRSIFGLYEFRAANAMRSTFGNSNHLAGFLNLGGLLALGLAAAAKARWERLGWGAIFLGCAVGTFLSASRAGFVALLGGAALLAILGFGTARRRDGWQSWLTLGGATAAATSLAVWIYFQFPRLLREIATLLDLDPASEEGKLEALSSGWRAALASWPTGIGKGAFETVGRIYQEKPFSGIWFTHVENEPVQAMAELGLPLGGLLALVVAGTWLGLAWRGRRSWAEAGAAAGVFALLLQNLADFSLQHASGLAAISLLAYAPRRRSRLRGDDRTDLAQSRRDAGRGEGEPRSAARAELAALDRDDRAVPVRPRGDAGERLRRGAARWGGAGVAGVMGAGLVAGAIAAWPGLDADSERLFAAAELSSLDELARLVRAASEERPGDYLPVDLMATRLLSEEDGSRQALPWINRLLFLQPHGPRGHLLAGEAMAGLGRGRQALLEYRTAATLGLPTTDRVVARFSSREAILEGSPTEAGPARRAALDLARLDRRADGIAVAERALEAAPDEEGLIAALYTLHLGAGQPEEALAYASRRRALFSSSEGAWADEAATLSRLERKEEARTLYLAGLEALPGSPAIVFGLAQLELAGRDPDAALRALARLRTTLPRPTRASYHALRAQAFRAQRSLIKARDELRLASRLAPERAHLKIQLADVLLQLGRTEEAAKALAGLDDSPSVQAAHDRVERQAVRDRQAKAALEIERLERAAQPK